MRRILNLGCGNGTFGPSQGIDDADGHAFRLVCFLNKWWTSSTFPSVRVRTPACSDRNHQHFFDSTSSDTVYHFVH